MDGTEMVRPAVSRRERLRQEREERILEAAAAIFARKADLAERFYVHLFTRLPEARAMFRGNFVKQKAMLMGMIAACVRKLDDPQALAALSGQLLHR